MHDHPGSSPLGMRDVIAAWVVCLAVAAAALIYPGIVTDAKDSIAQASVHAPPSQTQLQKICKLGRSAIQPGHG